MLNDATRRATNHGMHVKWAALRIDPPGSHYEPRWSLSCLLCLGAHWKGTQLEFEKIMFSCVHTVLIDWICATLMQD